MLPKTTLAVGVQSANLVFASQVNGLPAPGGAQWTGWGVQSLTGNIVKNITVSFDSTSGMYGVHWWMVFVPKQNQAVQGTPVVQVENTGAFPISRYEPNQHVMGHGVCGPDKVIFRCRGRRLRSGDSIMLILYYVEMSDSTPQTLQVQAEVDMSICQI